MLAKRRLVWLAVMAVTLLCAWFEPWRRGTRPQAPETPAPAAFDDIDVHLPGLPRERIVRVAADDDAFHLGLASDVVVRAHGFRVEFNPEDGPRPPGAVPALDDVSDRVLVGEVDELLVGSDVGRELRVGVFCDPDPDLDDGVSCTRLRELVAAPSQPATLFLTYANGDKLYFAGYTPLALQAEASRDAIENLRASHRTARARLDGAPRPPIGERVADEVARMARSPRDEYDAMRALMVLGPSALPAIVRAMGDRRRLPSRIIQVENPPGFFEAYATYGLEDVSGALAIVASRLSNGPWCDTLMSAGEDPIRESDRRRCQERWTRFVARGLDEGSFGEEWR